VGQNLLVLSDCKVYRAPADEGEFRVISGSADMALRQDRCHFLVCLVLFKEQLEYDLLAPFPDLIWVSIVAAMPLFGGSAILLSCTLSDAIAGWAKASEHEMCKTFGTAKIIPDLMSLVALRLDA